MTSAHLEILVEEKSMERFLEGVLPRILPSPYCLGANCFIRPHEGKQDLQKSIANKVRAYRNYPHPVKLIIIQDQDHADCRALKSEIVGKVASIDARMPLLVRIACRELENWYLGDLHSVESIYPQSKASRKANKAKFRTPDDLKGSQEMESLSSHFQKGDCASKIGKHISTTQNKSTSFNHLVSGIQKFCQE